MKSEFAWLLALAITIGAIGCEKPVSLVNRTEADPEAVEADIKPPTEESAPPPIEVAELSPRERILAVRARSLGNTFRDLEFNGTPLGDGSIVSIDDNGVRLQLQAGPADFSWAELPAPLRERWGHDSTVFPVPSTNDSAAASELAATEPEGPAPILLDPRTQARVRALESQITKLSENLKNARNTVEEAQVFHGELVAIYEADEKEAAALKAARVFARMRASSCSS